MSIIIESIDSVVKIRLNRPEKYNSFNREMALQMQQALDKAANDKSIRAIFITGEGKAFSAGQDLSEAIDPDGPGIEKIVREHYNPIINRIRQLEKPVVAAVNGVAAGAGANIALCCDIIVAAESASFIQAFSKIGLIPDSGGTFTLPRLIGWQKASALMMTGDKVSANEAERLGMIYKVFADVTFEEETRKIAHTIAQMPTKGLAYTKHVLNYSFNNSWEEQLQLEDQFQQKAASTDDYQEGIAAFLEKRSPTYKGE